ncbi:cell division ATP-binding protein FtsE [Candidatus Gottesmanbacteria bacterium CG11_big_fil_rev_8_21_14_0_20_37_11]|uniref:Cell division ATP-binding protein FtsE n=3 Tax=Candidatus Gottesmaniibacteriota TaxID=1752720 RepID=A0A2M7RQK1_9BACT|nr:MAG: cell division ATP-binding protein FtsE [Candidatus Gottesmanbacteria bacterium CG1_02_37_22]PIP32856.1 MAG: cell division ATP-binding protein FtsE [Candidatus Gottesmanbacteria bacterium CG23_combo_of_CG06-09_8_20_14_all_37_19]PIR07900.1 MAG: cell division ATP-binding protein FtsE [Candidatus Gottesmanbacteria bacterium CG11_big_fil_rev_8_21_14_0_20_37_11]PIZ02593.1 MAG: cell division ATP-binding protein FtsE [Candidatus Gottesmanbacteria bacterium CG_4_10_14_0_8_um_filter_37_24]
MILFNGVEKKYPGEVTGLDSISVRIEDGEFVFLVGPSGAGKTTLLKLLIREIIPTSGTVCIDDWEINKLSSRQLPLLRRKVGFVFQDFKLLMDRTIFENIAVSLEILGKGSSEIKERVYEVMKIVHLEEKSNYFPKQLSFGEQQRVAIGRAIAGSARILLADEPTGNLDPKTSWEILKIINDINKLGTTVLMATHNVDIVNSLKKRVLVIEKGKIVKDTKKSKYAK